MSERLKTILISSFAGIGAGFIMAVVILYMMIANSYRMNNLSFALCILVAICLPQWVKILGKWGLDPFVTECAMVIASLIICVIYAGYVTSTELTAGYTDLFNTVLINVIILHACAAGSVLVSYFLNKRQNLKG